MRQKVCMDDVVGEEVARPRERNREWTQIDANLEDDRPGRRGPHLVTRSEKKDGKREVFGKTPNTAAKPTALSMHTISEHSRQLASIGGLMPQFWIFPHSLTQLVDFHVYFSYFYLGMPARNQDAPADEIFGRGERLRARNFVRIGSPSPIQLPIGPPATFRRLLPFASSFRNL